MGKLIDIRKFNGESYEISTEGLKRVCPLYKVDSEMWIVGNEHLSFGTDVEFTRKAGRELAKKLEKFEADCIFTAETKSLGYAFVISQNLGHSYFAVARKTIKPYNTKYMSTEICSITSAKKEVIYIDELTIARIKNRKIILFDDVISTGSTMHGLMKLAKEVDAEVCAIASIWLEGYGPFEQFTEEFQSERLMFIDILPVFALGNTYKELCSKQRYYEKKLKINGNNR